MTLATPEGTRTYADEHDAADGHYRTVDDLTVSSLGMGSYLGEITEEAREAYVESAVTCLENGVNVLDTAINYRNQVSERDLGEALDRFGDRDQVVVVTKGGFIHGDGETDPKTHVQFDYIDEGVIDFEDVVGGVHCMTPDYLRHEIETSLDNLGLDAVDYYLVHNPETQLSNGVDPDTFRDRLRAAFEVMEEATEQEKIGAYGVATWEGFRLPSNSPAHLPLRQVLDLAAEAAENVRGTDDHRFRAIQLPLNLALTEAANKPTQSWDGDEVPILEAARDAGLLTLTSASMMQAKILGHIREEVMKVLDADTDVEACLQFARSCPGVTTALCGMGTPEHAEENATIMRRRSPDADRVRALLGG